MFKGLRHNKYAFGEKGNIIKKNKYAVQKISG